jgi:hypothetical protein
MVHPTEAERAALLVVIAPRITVDLPTAEQEYGHSIHILLELIHSFENDFANALELFDHLAAQERQFPLNKYPHKWALIPARDAVITVCNVREALSELNKALKNCPTVRKSLGEHVLAPIIGTFNGAFPHTKIMRDTRAHPVQRLATYAQRKTHGLASLPGLLVVHSHLQGRTITYTHQRNARSLEITPASLNVIQKTKRELFDLFRPFDKTDYFQVPT